MSFYFFPFHSHITSVTSSLSTKPTNHDSNQSCFSTFLANANLMLHCNICKSLATVDKHVCQVTQIYMWKNQ